MKATKKKPAGHQGARSENISSTHSVPATERQLLRKVGLRISKDLYEKEKPVEWLAFETGVARSTLREIIAGRSNVRILTLKSISDGLGYKSLADFFKNL